MDDVVKAAANLKKALAQMELDIARDESERKKLLGDLDYPTEENSAESIMDRLLQKSRRNKEIVAAIQSIETALRNSKASLERMAAKADKDVAKIRNRRPTTRMGVHPYLIKKLTALKKAEQQVKFLQVELEKMADTVNWKLDRVARGAGTSFMIDRVKSYEAVIRQPGMYLQETKNLNILIMALDELHSKLKSEFPKVIR